MEWIQALVQNGPGIIRAASESGLGIIALCCLVIGTAGIVYLSRSRTTSPWVGFCVFVMLVLGTLGLSTVALFTGAKRPLDLAGAEVINFKTPYFNEATKTYRLLDASVKRIRNGQDTATPAWRELQERPDGNAEYEYVVKSVEPGRILFGRRPKGTVVDTTELMVDMDQRILCFRSSPEDENLQCPYALVGIR